MFVSAALCSTVRGHLILAENMMKKWEKVVTEWKARQQVSTNNGDKATSEEPQDSEYEREGDDDDNNEDSAITTETVFENDPVAYSSVWDVGEREPYIDFLFLFETLLCFNSWIRMDTFWESDSDCEEAKATSEASLESVRIMMDGIRRYTPRLDKKGKLMTNGWMIPKYHNLIHIVEQIQNFGPARLLDVESEESNHKEIVKLNAKTVQKRGKGVFDTQLAENIWWMQSLDMLREVAGIPEEHISQLQEGKSPYHFEQTRRTSRRQVEQSGLTKMNGTCSPGTRMGYEASRLCLSIHPSDG